MRADLTITVMTVFRWVAIFAILFVLLGHVYVASLALLPLVSLIDSNADQARLVRFIAAQTPGNEIWSFGSRIWNSRHGRFEISTIVWGQVREYMWMQGSCLK